MVDEAEPTETEDKPGDPPADDFGDEFENFATGASEEPNDPEPKPEPESKPEPVAEPAAEAAPEDIWAAASPEQKAAFDEAAADAHKYVSDKGRHAADKRRIAALELQLTNTAAPPAAVDDSLPNTLEGDAWRTVEAELPELATPLKEVLVGFHAENVALRKELSTFSDDRREQVLTTQQTILASEHSDWEDVADDGRFLQWAGGQPAHIQNMFNRNAERIVDGEETAHLMSLFKSSDMHAPPAPSPSSESQAASSAAETAGAPSKRDRETQRRLDGSISVPSSGPGAPSGPPDEFDAAFDHFAAAGS